MFGDGPWTSLKFSYIIAAITLHFLLGFVVAVLVYWLTSTILSRYSSILNMEDFFIKRFSLLLALSLSVVVHIWEDFVLRLF
jgi:hypothetical protein